MTTLGGDPTKIPIQFDPRLLRMSGLARRGNSRQDAVPFDTTYITHIKDNLWTGGCTDGLILPPDIKHVISLYPWERYTIKHRVDSENYNFMYDADVPDEERLLGIVNWAVRCLAQGPTLVHCQAGLNRSGLIAAMTLMFRYSMKPDAAINLLRTKRSPAVLCNPAFEAYLRDQT